MTPEAMRRFVSGFGGTPMPEAPAAAPVPAPKLYPIPDATPRHDRPFKLTIGMATYDDYDGVYFTLMALQFYHPEIFNDVELIVVDNHPDGPCSEALKGLDYWLKNYRYIPQPGNVGTSYSRDLVFREAAGEFVLCIDCHVLIAPGALARLLAYFQAFPETKDLLQGPLLGDDAKMMGTHFIPEWQQGMYGHWGNDPRGATPDAAPFEIPMQGLGLFCCRRAAWPGFNPLFRQFGGEEGYIHEKIRQRGGRALCLPFLRWIHRFNRPLGIPYPANWEERVRNYMIGHHELGLPLEDVETHFRQHLGDGLMDRILPPIREELAGLTTGDSNPHS